MHCFSLRRLLGLAPPHAAANPCYPLPLPASHLPYPGKLAYEHFVHPDASRMYTEASRVASPSCIPE